MIKHNCEFCGKEKEYKYKSKIRKYCSYKCSNKANWQTKKRAEMVTIICEVCGKPFSILASAKRSREKRSKIRYCSMKCLGIGMSKKKPAICKNCGKEFETTRNSFCSRQCVYEYKKKTGIAKKSGYWYENGYKVLYLGGKEGIKEHIKIMQDNLGRKLTSEEVVHHINGNILDNHIENLQLLTRAEHSRIHRKMEKANGKHLFGGYHNN